MKEKRLENMTEVDDPVTRVVVAGGFFRKALSQWSRPQAIDGRLVSDRGSIAKEWASCLYTKLDGRGLSDMSLCKGPSDWVSNPLRTQNGARFIGAIKARGGILYSKVRASRGRPERDIRCDACLRPESAQHMIQVCERTNGPRIKRHDDIVKFLKTGSEKAGFATLIEPRINGGRLGLRKPDLVIYKDNRVFVVDVTIVSDQVSVDLAHQQKSSTTINLRFENGSSEQPVLLT